MIKNRVVVFTTNNARMITTDDVSAYQGRKNCVINPDLSLVLTTPPHLWKLVDGTVMPMDGEEKKKRELLIATSKIDNDERSWLEKLHDHAHLIAMGAAILSFLVACMMVHIEFKLGRIQSEVSDGSR